MSKWHKLITKNYLTNFKKCEWDSASNGSQNGYKLITICLGKACKNLILFNSQKLIGDFYGRLVVYKR